MDIVSWLPEEISHAIFKLLGEEDLSKCCKVSKNWRRLANNNNLWKVLLLRNGYSTKLSHVIFSPTFKWTEDLFPQCEWHQRFVQEKRLLSNWKWGKFKLKIIKDKFTGMFSMNEGRIIILVVQNGLKAYKTMENSSELIKVEGMSEDYKWSIAGNSNNVIVVQVGPTKFFCYMCSTCQDTFPLIRHTSTLNIIDYCSSRKSNKEPTSSKCVGVLGNAICVFVREESTIYFLSAENGKKIGEATIEFDCPRFTSQLHTLYVYNETIIREYDKQGKKLLEIRWFDDIILPAKIYSNESIIIARGVSPEETRWFSPGVLQVWDRKNGKKLCRIPEDIKALSIHPCLPIFFYVPKPFQGMVKIVSFDAQKKCTLWETAPSVLPTSNISVHLTLVRGQFLFCALYMFNFHNKRTAFGSDQFLLDLESRTEYDYKLSEHREKLVWSNEQCLIFQSNCRNRKYIKIVCH